MVPKPNGHCTRPIRVCRSIAAVLVVCLCLGTGQLATPTMTLHCIDVGQADSSLLEFTCGAVLIDAGADTDHKGAVVAYLKHFFEGRSDLHQTLDAIIITHSHIDHTSELRAVVEAFTVRNVIDNGDRDGSGKAGLLWLQNEGAAAHHVEFHAVTQRDVEGAAGGRGLTDEHIDPITCPTCNPEIHILSASPDHDPGWPPGAFENENNHSLVVRVDFGASSFLFPGDLEEPAIEGLVQSYSGGHALDVDVIHVGHHGSDNGTTDSLLTAVTPQLAVISMGYWSFGEKPDGSARAFTTYAYGHPRVQTLDRLQKAIPTKRPRAVSVMAASAARHFQTYTVKQRVYATGWDGSIDIVADPRQMYRTTTRGHTP